MGFNYYFFNLFFRFAGKNFFLDDVGIFLARYFLYFLIVGALILIFSENTWKKKILFLSETLLATILGRGLITEIIRFFYNHPRPFAALNFTPLIPESGNSFPSGHTVFLFALALIIFYWNRRWGIWYLVSAAVVGLARIFVGVHWPLDILGGAAIGLLSALFVHWLVSPYVREISPGE